VIQREIEIVEMELESRGLEKSLSSSPANAMQAVLPEPSHPPPPPPPFNQQPAKANDEPIYEAVLPRDEDNVSPPPLPTPPHKLIRAKSPVAIESVNRSISPAATAAAAALSSPRQSRPSSRTSGTGVSKTIGLKNNCLNIAINLLVFTCSPIYVHVSVLFGKDIFYSKNNS